MFDKYKTRDSNSILDETDYSISIFSNDDNSLFKITKSLSYVLKAVVLIYYCFELNERLIQSYIKDTTKLCHRLLSLNLYYIKEEKNIAPETIKTIKDYEEISMNIMRNNYKHYKENNKNISLEVDDCKNVYFATLPLDVFSSSKIVSIATTLKEKGMDNINILIKKDKVHLRSITFFDYCKYKNKKLYGGSKNYVLLNYNRDGSISMVSSN